MVARSPDWSHCDVLLKEVGALRASTNRRTDLDDVMEADINLKIVAAAQAIDELIDCPGSDEKPSWPGRPSSSPRTSSTACERRPRTAASSYREGSSCGDVRSTR